MFLAAALILVANAAASSTPTVWDWNHCLTTALERSPRLAASRVRVTEQEGAALADRAALLPSLNSTALTLPPVATFELRQSILNLPAMAAASGGQAGITAARANHELERWRLVEELRAAYLQVEFRQRALELRGQFVAELESNLETAGTLFEADRARAADIRRLEVNLGAARAEAGAARTALDNAWLDLAELMGTGASEVSGISPAVQPVFQPWLPENMDESAWVSAALEHRPDLRALQALRGASQWRLTAIERAGFSVVAAVANTSLAPDLDFIGDTAVLRNQDDDRIASSFFFGANFNWEIWDGGQRRGQATATRAGIEELDTGIHRLRSQTIPSQVRRALNSLRAAEQAYRVVDRPQHAGESYQSQAAQLVDAGRITQLEFLDVSRDRLRRREEALQALFQVELARLALQTASGMLIEHR